MDSPCDALPKTDADPDASLTRRAMAGDPDAFDQLSRRHYPRLLRVLRRLLDDPDAAEDVAQETFLAAWRNLPRFRGDAAFATWLHSVAARRACAFACRESRRRCINLDERGMEIPADASGEPHRAAARREEAERIRAAVEKLPERQRLTALLFYYGEASCREIADELGMEESTVRGHLRRAREGLRRRLKDVKEIER
jgi:RNA polymerase sigma-70 factor (ECF subfamily)